MIIKGQLQKLIERIENSNWKDCDRPHMARRAKKTINELQERGVDGVDKFVQKLLGRVGNKEAYLDILMEGRFAIVLARNGFVDIHIEYNAKGPDLKTMWNNDTIYFEITRRHSEIDEWKEHDGAFVMGGDKVETVIAKIQGKVKQLPDGEINIVVIWSDTINLITHNMEKAFDYILQEIKVDPQKYKDLSGVLFTESGGVDTATFKQFYLFNNEKATKPLKPSLVEKLGVLLERDKVELQTENEELLAALKSLRYPPTPSPTPPPPS